MVTNESIPLVIRQAQNDSALFVVTQLISRGNELDWSSHFYVNCVWPAITHFQIYTSARAVTQT